MSDRRTPTPTFVMHDSYRHKTPYGKWNAKLQKSGVWAASFRATAGNPAFGVRILDRAVRGWGDFHHPDLPAVHSITPEDRRVNWILPQGEDWAPLSAGPARLPALEVRRVVFEVGELLTALHAAGLAAGDLSPDLVFMDGEGGRLTLLPTLGLADFTGIDPDPVGKQKYVAPEYGGKAPVLFDPARADVYALGMLARRLLRGSPRPGRAGASVPDVDPMSGDWDLFFAGCIARSPGRRYSSVRASFGALGWDGTAEPTAPRSNPTDLSVSCPLCGAGPRQYPAERAGEFVYCHACSREFRLDPGGRATAPTWPAPVARRAWDRRAADALDDHVAVVSRRHDKAGATPLDLDWETPAEPVGVPEVFAAAAVALAVAGVALFLTGGGKLLPAGLTGAGLVLAVLSLLGLEGRKWLGQSAATLCAVVLVGLLAADSGTYRPVRTGPAASPGPGEKRSTTKHTNDTK